ncbi:MFS general substrate transporter [Lindgomyces ingoldianus]|uniref:MFS general substrate transporter n=1 Tax=Lindgomyces ingoldianus TaxID=673940 RepID=A0ACB6QBV0_9PLEO|nr:MFS general substrate transporter [Lindgomyces ingoldianus]KAF2464387.1 MFS general substrate transporter [Lindgomyces ingoldianus]
MYVAAALGSRLAHVRRCFGNLRFSHCLLLVMASAPDISSQVTLDRIHHSPPPTAPPAQNQRATRLPQQQLHTRRRRRLDLFPDLVDVTRHHEFLRVHLNEKGEKLLYITHRLDKNGFDVRVFLVAASGFLTDSYILFVTNTVIPSIMYVYMHDKPDQAATFELWMNLSTLIGSIVGQIVFGILADIYGRTSLYGWELVIVIFATFGFAFTSEGIAPVAVTPQAPSLNLKTAFYCWRFLTGFGIGAEYPLSAVLTAEWASVHHRGQMLAAVFAMQPLGQLCAALAGLSAISIVDRIHNVQGDVRRSGIVYTDSSRVAVDRVWRGVVLFGAIPSVIALLFRFYLPDPGRYTLEVQEDIDRAVKDTDTEIEKNALWAWPKSLWPWKKKLTAEEQVELSQGRETRRGTEDTADTASTQPTDAEDNDQSLSDLWTYLWEERNWTLLFGTCVTWFLLDVVFYGLGISSPHTLAVVWADRALPLTGTQKVDPWNPDPTHPNDTIVDVLDRNSRRLIYTSVIGSLVGSVALIFSMNWIRRKWLLQWSFLVIACFLVATGVSMRLTFGSKNWLATFAFYVVCQILFNFGPNTLTFLIPAEIFSTRYRCTLHGLSAASGKLGSVLIRIILHESVRKKSDQNAFNQQAVKLSWTLIAFSVVMALGFPITKIFLPDVQRDQRREDGTLVDKTLEDLSPGLSAAERDNQLLGALWFREHWPSLLSRNRRRGAGNDVSRSPSPSNYSRPSHDHERSHTQDGSLRHEDPVGEHLSVASVPESSESQSSSVL